MTNRSNSEPEKESPKTEEAEQEQTIVPEQGDNHQNSYNSRKAGKSKREIMEDLSRARFPWDE